MTHAGGGRQLEKGRTEHIEYREVAANGHRVQGGGRQAVTHGGGGRQLEKGRTELIEYREAAARQRLMEEVAR